MDNSEEDTMYDSDNQMEDSEEDSSSEQEDLENLQNKKRKLKVDHNQEKRFKTENTENEGLEKHKKAKNGIYKPPTAEELSQLRETETLFNSNLFRLQIDELLKEIKIKQKYIDLFAVWFENFQKFIENIPEYEDVKISELANAKTRTKNKKFLNNLINIHRGKLKSDHDVTLKFIKPQECRIFGLHKIDSSIGPKLNVNISIVMPKRCFLERDYLNNRYFVKRDYYLSYIYLHLKKLDLCSDKSFLHKNSVLCIIPQVSEKIQICVHAVPAENSFKLSRFEPNINNIRENLFDNLDDIETEELKESGTPLYNSLILNDLTLNSNYNALKELKNVQDGIKLLSVWLRQRDLCSDHSFSEALLIQTILYLVLKRKINKHMSSYQVIRNFWVFVSTTNWHHNPISICEDVKVDKLKNFRNNFDVVFLDESGYYNLAAFLHLNTYMKIKSEAKLAVKYLDDIKFDSFRALFVTKVNPELQYDALLTLKDSKHFKNVYKNISNSEKCKYIGCFPTLIIKNILRLLNKGLNKRVMHIVPLLSEQRENSDPLTTITLGLTLNPEEAFKVTERGPPSNTSEGLEFRNFWGKLSECRRFADGSICEAIYFPASTIQEKRKIFKKVIDFIVTEKLKIEEHFIISDDFENLLNVKNYITPFPSGTGEEANLRIISVFDELSKKMRECDLPLEIAAIQGISEFFSYTAPFPPVATNYRGGAKITSFKENNIILNVEAKFGAIPYVEPIYCVIQLGMSSKWPHDLEAIRHLKVGFYFELAKKLNQEDQIVTNVNPKYLEVLYGGLVFRFQLSNPREISALKKVTAPNGMTSYKDTEESVELEKQLFILPRIVGALHAVQSYYPSFGPSTALIKRWLRSQLIDEYYLPDIVVDLLNASLYLNGAPYNNANLPQVAFFRFLKYIAELDWNTQLVVVNFNDELTKDVLDNIEMNFQQNRQNYPPLCIITPYEEGKSLFSKKCSKEILNRILVLTRLAFEAMQTGISTHNLSVAKELFVPNLEGYDVIIHLKSFFNPRRHQQFDFLKKGESKLVIEEYNESEISKIPVVDFDPVEFYINDLRKGYGNLALFFYDPYGGNTIGVLWQPKTLEKREFKVSCIEGRKLVKNNLELNTAAIVEDFFVLGNGLVNSVEECN